MALKVKDPSNRAKAVEVNASDSGVVDEVEELKKKLYIIRIYDVFEGIHQMAAFNHWY